MHLEEAIMQIGLVQNGPIAQAEPEVGKHLPRSFSTNHEDFAR
jgi:hypothetical protein